MFSWVADLIANMRQSIMDGFAAIGNLLADTIWAKMIHWMYETVYGAIADFFTMMGKMGAEIFDLAWVQATIRLFTLLGWALFIAGMVVAIFDVAIEYQTGRANIKTTVLNILKGFFACSLIGVVPVELYKLCITLQHTFASDLGTLFADVRISDMASLCKDVFFANFTLTGGAMRRLFHLIAIIMFAYCVVKVFFQNIKRGGILLVQMSVGSLYMFSVPRGYTDGFTQWMKQIVATCLTAFMQTTLLYLGLLTLPDNMLLGIGIMLSASEVPRIAQQFGLDSSMKFNMMSVVHATTTAINLTRMVAKAK